MSVTIPGRAPGNLAEAGLSKGPFRAARGTAISCKGWQQEAALRMLLNDRYTEEQVLRSDGLGYRAAGRARIREFGCGEQGRGRGTDNA